jgi:hypothetical protein
MFIKNFWLFFSGLTAGAAIPALIHGMPPYSLAASIIAFLLWWTSPAK